MKKVFLFAAAIALTLASCGSKTANNAAEGDSTAVENVADSTGEASEAALSGETAQNVSELTDALQKAIDSKDGSSAISALAKAQEIYKNLVAQGKLDEAKAYGAAVQKWVSDNKEAIKNAANGNTTVADLVNGISNLPTSANATAEQAKAAADAAAKVIDNIPSDVKKAATDAATKAADKAVNDAKDAANKAANDAKDAAKAKANEEVNKAKQKANDAVNNAANKALKGLGL